MAEEDRNTKENETNTPEKVGGKTQKMILWAAAGGGALLLVVALILVMGFSSGEKKEEIQELNLTFPFPSEDLLPEGYDDEEQYEADDEPLGAMYPLESFVVNLAGQQHYLRCQVLIEFNERDVPRRFYSRLIPIRDALLDLLASRTPEEIGNTRGRETLKEEIQILVDRALRKQVVKNVYFTQFVIQ